MQDDNELPVHIFMNDQTVTAALNVSIIVHLSRALPYPKMLEISISLHMFFHSQVLDTRCSYHISRHAHSVQRQQHEISTCSTSLVQYACAQALNNK